MDLASLFAQSKCPPQIQQSGFLRVIRIFILCMLYMIIGPALIVVNNQIMREHEFPYPTSLSALGVISSAVVARIVVIMDWGKIKPENAREVAGGDFWRRLYPIGVLHACTLAFGNAVYLYLGVGFVQMLKAFTPVVILCVLYMFKVEYPTRQLAASVAVISFGTIVTTTTSPETSLLGLLLVFLSEVCEASRLVLTQNLLCNLSFSVLEGQYFLAPLSSAALVTMACVFEAPRAAHAAQGSEATNPLNALLGAPHLFTLAATLGVVVNYLGFLVIREVGSLTFKVLGTLRNIGLVMYGVLFLGEAVSSTECTGYAISLAGFTAYTFLKATQQQHQQNQPPSAPPSKAIASGGTQDHDDASDPLLGQEDAHRGDSGIAEHP